MKFYSVEELRKEKAKRKGVSEDTSLSNAEKSNNKENYNVYNDFGDEGYVENWFKKSQSLLDSQKNSDNSYDTAKSMGEFSQHVKGMVNDPTIDRYVNAYSGTKNYEALKNQVAQYKAALSDLADYTSGLSQFASQYDNEEDYNRARKALGYNQKYATLRTYDDFLRAAEQTDDEEEKQWLSQKGEEIATPTDVQNAIDKLKNSGEAEVVIRKNLFGTVEPAIPELERLESLKKEKESEEKYDKYYNNLDPEVKKILERYYYVEKNKDKNIGEENPDEAPVLPDDDEAAENIEKDFKKEKLEATSDFRRLSEQGYDIDELYKWYSRAKEHKEAEESLKEQADLITQNPGTAAIASLGSVITHPIAAANTASDYIKAEGDKLFNNGDGYIDPSLTSEKAIQNTRDAVSKSIDNPIGSFLYETGMSMGDFASLLPLNALPGGQTVSLAIMSTEAGTQAANEAIENGSTLEQALATGVASGIAEAFFEKMSIDQLKAFKQSGSSSVKDIVQNVFRGMATEGSEEAFTDFANLITDNIINGDVSQFSKNKENYLKAGYNDAEAELKAWQDFGIQVAQSAAGGALSGGVMNAGAAGMNYAGNAIEGSDVKAQGNAEELLKLGKYYQQDSKRASKLVKKLEDSQSKDKNYSNAQLGQLRREVMSAASEKEQGFKSKKAQSLLKDSGLNEKEQAIATKFFDGEKLTQAEADVINTSEGLREFIRTIPESDGGHRTNFVKALSAVKYELPRVKAVDYNKVDTKGMTQENALKASAEAQGFSPETVKTFVNNYDGKLSVDQYTQEFLNFHNIGRQLAPMSVLNQHAYTIPESTRIAAYETGKNVYVEHAKTQYALTQAQQEWKKTQGGYAEGTVDKSGIDESKLNQNQRDSIEYLSAFAKFGVNVKFYKSKNTLGKLVDPNGYYDPETHTIGVAVDSMNKRTGDSAVRGAMLATFAHELTHVSERAPELYTELRENVSKAFGAKWESAVNVQLDNLKQNHPDIVNELSEDELTERASQEALAECCSDMLNHSDILEKMAQENPKALGKVIEVVRKVINRLRELKRKLFKEDDTNKNYRAAEAKYLQQQIDDMQKVVDLWEKTVTEGIKNQNARQAVKEKNSGTGVQEQLRDIPDEKTIEKNIELVANMESVISLSGEEFKKGKIDLITQVSKYFETIGGKVSTEYGIVSLNEQSARDSLAHGIGRNKAIAFKAVPFVLKKGKIIDFQKKWKGNESRVAFAAPITIANVPHYMVAIVQVFDENNHFYLHEVALQEKGDSAFKTGTAKSGTPSAKSPSIFSLLKKLQDVNQNSAQKSSKDFVQYQDRQIYSKNFKEWFGDWENDSKNASKIVDEDGKPLVVYHGTDADFTVFDKTKGRSGMDIQGMFFSPWELDAGGYGSNVRAFYLNIKNPAPEGLAYKVLNKFAGENYAGIKAREELERMGYDGVNNGDEEYIAFYPEQIKSATDNIGTFDKNNPDIQYQSRNVEQIDRDYLTAVERGDLDTAQRMVDEAAKAAGYDLHLYHGSKSGGGFTVFKDWQYFTGSKDYADRYTNRDSGTGLYDVYVKSSRMFDTRNRTERELFNKFRMEYGMGELQKNGLPDWTDGYDIAEIIEENNLDYDGIVLDEGGDLVNGKPVSRGESYVIRESNQIKSADTVTYDDNGEAIPLSERFKAENKDIRYQDRNSEQYTYDELVKKPDMKVATISSKVYNRADTVFYAKQNAAKIGKRNSKNEVSVYVDDLNSDVVLTTEGLRHGLTRKLNVISPVTVNIGGILKDSIVINELKPKKVNASNTYVLIGIAKFDNGEPVIVRSIVNEYDNTLQSIETLYAINAKKEPTATVSPRYTNNNSLSFIGSTISISDLLDYVNKYYPDILPQDVLKHYGHKTRPKSELSESVKYQDREGINTEADYLNKAAEGSPDFDLFDFDDTDDDLFENEDNAIDFDKMVRDDPQQALELMYKSIVRQARESLADKDSGLTENSYRKIARKLIPKYAVENGHLIEITNIIRNFIENTDSENFEEKFTDFVLEMKNVLLYSNVLDETSAERIKNLRDDLHGTTLLIPKYEEAAIRSRYESVANYRNKLFGWGVNVAIEGGRGETDLQGKHKAVTIKDLIESLRDNLGEAYSLGDDIDGGNAFIAFEEYLHSVQPLYYNPYLDGLAENIDVAAIEMAADVITEYTREKGRAAVVNKNGNIAKLRDRLQKAEEQRDNLMKAGKENARVANDIRKYKYKLEKFNEETNKLDEINWLIKSGYHDERIAERKANAEKAVDKAQKDFFRLRSTQHIKKVVDERVKRAVKNERKLQKQMYVKWREQRDLTKVVNGIKKLGVRMAKMLVTPNNKAYVPTRLQDSFLTACKAVTDAMEGRSYSEAGRKLNDLKKLLSLMNRGGNEQEYAEYVDEFDSVSLEELENAADNISKKLNGKSLDRQNFTLEEANEIGELLTWVLDTVKSARKMLDDKYSATVQESAEKVREDFLQLEEKNYNKIKTFKNFKGKLLNAMRTARMYTGYNENSELMRLMNELEEGGRREQQYIMEADKIFHEVMDGKEGETKKQKAKRRKDYDKFIHSVFEVEFKNYKGETQKVKMTPSMAVQEIMMWQREMSDGHLQHMQKGGLLVYDAELTAKGKPEKAREKAVYIHAVNQTMQTGILKQLDKFCDEHNTKLPWEYKEAAEKYFNEYGKNKINEVSNKIKHRDLATSEYYIPFKIDKGQTKASPKEIEYSYKILNAGSLKRLRYHAPQTVELGGLNSIIQEDINEKARIWGFAVPLRNFEKVLNYQFFEEASIETEEESKSIRIPKGSVYSLINKIWGEKGKLFFEQVDTDLNKQRAMTTDLDKTQHKISSKIREAMIVKTLVGNISVTIKQAASYPTAGLYLDAKALSVGLEKMLIHRTGINRYQALFDEIDKYTPAHYIRRKGLSIPEINEIANTWADKVNKKIPKKIRSINPQNWIQGVDVLTTAMLWEATKSQVKSNFKKNGRRGQYESSEYWQEVTRIYNKVLNDTQPMYDTLHRAEIQKSSGFFSRYVFLFKTQPLQNTGILVDAMGDMLANRSKEKVKVFAKAVASQISSLAVFSVMGLTAYLVQHNIKRYKDDDDEITPESVFFTVLGDMGQNAASLLAPLGGTELVELIRNVCEHKLSLSNYDLLNVPAIDMITDTAKSLIKFAQTLLDQKERIDCGFGFDIMSVGAALGDFLVDCLGFGGVPIENADKIKNSVIGYYTDWQAGALFSDLKENREPKSYAKSYGRHYTAGESEKAKEQLDELYQKKYEEQKSKGEYDVDAYKNAREAVRDALVNAYKEEYQRAYLRYDREKQQEISNLLQHSGYMFYENGRMLSDVLFDWRKNAKDNIGKKYK